MERRGEGARSQVVSCLPRKEKDRAKQLFVDSILWIAAAQLNGSEQRVLWHPVQVKALWAQKMGRAKAKKMIASADVQEVIHAFNASNIAPVAEQETHKVAWQGSACCLEELGHPDDKGPKGTEGKVELGIGVRAKAIQNGNVTALADMFQGMKKLRRSFYDHLISSEFQWARQL